MSKAPKQGKNQLLDHFVMITFEGRSRNGYAAIYTRKLLLKIITCIYLIGCNKPFEECCLFGSLIRGGRDL